MMLKKNKKKQFCYLLRVVKNSIEKYKKTT